jgi:N-acetylglucosaminyldiphosphoundecaprenol N-acetyl-beta-D-mannosaminyltransferase
VIGTGNVRQAPFDSVILAGIPIHRATFAESLDEIEILARGSTATFVTTPNVDHIVLFNRDVDFRTAYESSSLTLADGAPLVLLSRLLGQSLPCRVAGADLLPAMCKRASETDLRVYILGGATGVAEKARQRLVIRYPGLQVLGVSSPPLGFELNPEAGKRELARIRDFAPNILFVCLGTPKQEKWISAHLQDLPPLVALCVGAAVDFAAGNIRRAPSIVRWLGLEWLYRLLREPRRLWRRYLVRDMAFARYAVRDLLARGPSSPIRPNLSGPDT